MKLKKGMFVEVELGMRTHIAQIEDLTYGKVPQAIVRVISGNRKNDRIRVNQWQVVDIHTPEEMPELYL